MSRTLLEMRQVVKDDLDLDEETFVTDQDLNEWINKGIRSAERQIHTLYEDYFLNEEVIGIVAGGNLVDYPADIYANKIRKIVFFESSTNSHEVKKLKRLTDGIEMDLNSTSSISTLVWSPVNGAVSGRKIRLFPSNGRTGSLSVWYIRNAKVLVADTDVCDIDEFEDYVIQTVKTMAYFKDGDPRTTESKALEEELKVDLILTLSDMVPDNDNELEKDMSFYEDSV